MRRNNILSIPTHLTSSSTSCSISALQKRSTMASMCTRCALRLQRQAAASQNFSQYNRALSTTPSRSKTVPTFQPTSQPELDDVLASFRTKHFIPRMLPKPQRKLVLGQNNKAYLEENPQSITLGDEDIKLKWIDARTEIPNRVRLLKKALELMRDGEKQDWNNLPALLAGLHAVDKTPDDRQLAKIIRLASRSGRFGTILACLHQADRTGMTMKKEAVLDGVMWAVRELGREQDGAWSKEALEKAIKDANEVGKQLEDKKHGTGSFVRTNDPRRRPEVLSVFLELVAVYSYRFQDGRDVDGKVKTLTERLLDNIEGAEAVSHSNAVDYRLLPKLTSMQPRTNEPATTGPQFEVLRGVPLWHGLRLAQQILGDEMPRAELASRVVNAWQGGLRELTRKLEARDVNPGTHPAQALEVLRDRVID